MYTCIRKWRQEGSKGKLQSLIVETIRTHTPNTWNDIIHSRADTLLPQCPFGLSFSSLASEFAKLRKLRGYSNRYSLCLIQTWEKSWTTSTRFHESVCLPPCIFGCAAKDEQRHYIACEPLWTIIHSCTGARCTDLDSDPSELICLSKPSLRTVRRLFTAYCCYHKLRFENREEIDGTVCANDFEMVIELLIAYARIVAGEHPWYLC